MGLQNTAQFYMVKRVLILFPQTLNNGNYMDQEIFKKSAKLISQRNVSDRVLRVIVSFDQHEGLLKVLYCLQGCPKEGDYEDCELTCTELIAEFPDIRQAETECISNAECVKDIGDVKDVVFLKTRE